MSDQVAEVCKPLKKGQQVRRAASWYMSEGHLERERWLVAAIGRDCLMNAMLIYYIALRIQTQFKKAMLFDLIPEFSVS